MAYMHIKYHATIFSTDIWSSLDKLGFWIIYNVWWPIAPFVFVQKVQVQNLPWKTRESTKQLHIATATCFMDSSDTSVNLRCYFLNLYAVHHLPVSCIIKSSLSMEYIQFGLVLNTTWYKRKHGIVISLMGYLYKCT
jgi:hypothetical protein